MAQALFDEHPLEQYLRNVGEARDLVPGSTAEFEFELDPWWGTDFEDTNIEWRPPVMIKVTEIILAVILALDLSSLCGRSSSFLERFKYDVISSTLLAVSLSSAHARTPQSSLPDLPGQLNHSQTSTAHQNTPTSLPALPHDSLYLIPAFVLAVCGLSLHAGYSLLALATLGITVYTVNANKTSKHDMSPSLETLNELIASNNDWEKAVQAALNIVDNDEPNTLYGAATPPSSLSLRVVLHTTLLTTQTQCDNVRQLFSVLTSPTELSQLSEMYAPPSPVTSSFSHDGRTRPLSLPSRRRTMSMPSDPFLSNEAKRQIWSEPYSRLGQLESPTIQTRVKRRFGLSPVPQTLTSGPPLTTTSAPVTPPQSSIPRVTEESESEYEDACEHVPHTVDGTLTFGAAALALHRKRKTGGMEAFRSPPTSYSSSGPFRFTPQSPRTPPPVSSTYHPGSRLTPVQAARHPLSFSALHHALQSALASKRFACSHLLALRFTDEEDDGYWEDVRSVMGLLTTTFVDASSRLSEAITEVEQQKLRDQNPTPPSSKDFTYDSDKSMESSVGSSSPLSSRRNTSISFAPLPSHLSRFAAHVDAIQSALDDARENLQQCVKALRERETRPPNSVILDRHRRRRTRFTAISPAADEPSALLPPISPAIEAYERLRRELGLALRECERGRERLLDVVYPLDMYDPEEDSNDDVPVLGHDGSDESDKPDSVFPFDIEQESPPAGYAVVALEAADGGAMDDATSHLLLSTSTQHLPSPGIEQVFEADTGSVGVFKRERSKLTREERIRLMKAKRENGSGMLRLALSTMGQETERGGGGGAEKWGPGGEVVQELKDVIWKVGERKRRMADADSSKGLGAAPSSEPTQLDDAPA